MQDGRKAVWNIPYVSVAFFPSLKQNFIAYRSSKVSSGPDCIFEIHQLWQSGFSRVNCQESATILNVSTKKSEDLLKPSRTSFPAQHPHVNVCVCVCVCVCVSRI